MATSLETLGKNISVYRKRAGLNQTQLADAVGVEQGTVSAWESGKIDLPYSTLCRIAGKLNTSPAALSDPSIPVVDSIDKKRLFLLSAIIESDGIEFETFFDALQPVIEGSAEQEKRRTRRP